MREVPSRPDLVPIGPLKALFLGNQRPTELPLTLKSDLWAQLGENGRSGPVGTFLTNRRPIDSAWENRQSARLILAAGFSPDRGKKHFFLENPRSGELPLTL